METTPERASGEPEEDIFFFVDEVARKVQDEYSLALLWDAYRSRPIPDLYAFLQILEQDYERDEAETERWAQDLERLHGAQWAKEGLKEPTPEQKSRAIAYSEENYKEAYRTEYISHIRATTIYQLIRYAIEHPDKEIPTWEGLQEEERRKYSKHNFLAGRARKHAADFVAVYDEQEGDFDKIGELQVAYEKRHKHDGFNRMQYVQGKMRDAGISWVHRDVHSLIDAMRRGIGRKKTLES